jgi:hypothetical protein
VAIPEARFDPGRAVPYFPIPVVKFAVLVPIYNEFPAYIRPEWDSTGDSPQVFIGSYYLIVGTDGQGRYGSAREQWENMHRQLPISTIIPGIPDALAWVKVLIPTGYEVDHECALVTLIPTESGEIRESRKALKPGTLVLRQPGGEFQFVRPEDQSVTYYSPVQATQMGLNRMSVEQFGDWAVKEATSTLVPV